jgi:shikimate kinase
MKSCLPIILMGPMATGKSSVASELTKQTGVPRAPLDMLRWYYYFKQGYSLEKDATFKSFSERLAYWKTFDVATIKNTIADFPESIIDFGAGHSYFPDEKQLKLIQETLASIQNIFLLLPNEDNEESFKICKTRLSTRDGIEAEKVEANRLFIEHPSTRALSKHIIYCKNESPAEIARRIIGLLK